MRLQVLSRDPAATTDAGLAAKTPDGGGAIIERAFPERLTGQGLDANQFESGDRTILALLNEPRA